MTTLRSTLTEIAESFAASVLDAIRNASVEELLAESRGVARGARPSMNGRATRSTAPRAARAGRPGRLPRRSDEDIAKALDQVLTLVRAHKEGLRAEQIRQELGMQAKEMPRILKAGTDKKALRTKGQKRATTYFAR